MCLCWTESKNDDILQEGSPHSAPPPFKINTMGLLDKKKIQISSPIYAIDMVDVNKLRLFRILLIVTKCSKVASTSHLFHLDISVGCLFPNKYHTVWNIKPWTFIMQLCLHICNCGPAYFFLSPLYSLIMKGNREVTVIKLVW